MTLAELRGQLPVIGLERMAFPRHLIGAFRRKSITFCTGLTDETTLVYWFQSRSFTIDLRLPDMAATPLTRRQAWVGDTRWDATREHMSWAIARSYQPRDQWPEPASFHLIGNCILEFAPSGAYVEDWRQQSTRGPLLGLRLRAMLDAASGREVPMDGGLILAGSHLAYAQSRLPQVDDRLRMAGDLDRALAEGVATEREVESYEVSIALDGKTIAYSTQPGRVASGIASGDFEVHRDGSILLSGRVGGTPCRLRFDLDVHIPDFSFDRQTGCTPQAREWLAGEAEHLARHARPAG